MIRRRMLPLLALAGASAVAAIAIAAAASLPVTSGTLSTYSISGSPPTSTCTLATSTADAYVDEATSSNFGTLTYLQSGTDFLDNRHTFVKFDVASCSIPSGAEIRSAILSLYMFDPPGSSYTTEVRRVTSSWGETTIDWYEYPSTAGSAVATFSTGTTAEAKISDVKANVQGFVDGTYANYGWRVMPSSDFREIVQFRSREHATASERPQLTITYYR